MQKERDPEQRLDLLESLLAARLPKVCGLHPVVAMAIDRFTGTDDVREKDKASTWVDLALSAGYSDQSHFNREFLEFTGVTPGQYRKILPASPYHVTVGRPDPK